MACTHVSDSGLNTALRKPSWIAALIEACWKSVETVCGLKIDPSNIAT